MVTKPQAVIWPFTENTVKIVHDYVMVTKPQAVIWPFTSEAAELGIETLSELQNRKR